MYIELYIMEGILSRCQVPIAKTFKNMITGIVPIDEAVKFAWEFNAISFNLSWVKFPAACCDKSE